MMTMVASGAVLGISSVMGMCVNDWIIGLFSIRFLEYFFTIILFVVNSLRREENLFVGY